MFGKKEYDLTVYSIAVDVWAEALEATDNDIEAARELIYEKVEETVGFHKWVQGSKFHLTVLQCTNSYDAFLSTHDFDSSSDIVSKQGVAALHSMMVHHAIAADVYEVANGLADKTINV